LPEIDNIVAVYRQNRSMCIRHQRTASEGSEAVSQKLFRARLDVSYPLAKLSRVMLWEAIENEVVEGVSARAGRARASGAADSADGRALVSQTCLQPLGLGDL